MSKVLVLAAALLAATALVTTEPAEAARNTRFKSLCGRNVTGLVFVQGQQVGLDYECPINVRAGGLLRILDSNVSGFPLLQIKLSGGAALELTRTGLAVEYTEITGDGTVRADTSYIRGNMVSFVRVTGDVELNRVDVSARGATVRSTRGRVKMTDSHVGSRDGAIVSAPRGVSLLWSSIGGGMGTAAVFTEDGGDISIIASSMYGNGVRVKAHGTAGAVTIVGSDIDGFYAPFNWPAEMLPPYRCTAYDNRPDIVCPWDPSELPERESGPRVFP